MPNVYMNSQHSDWRSVSFVKSVLSDGQVALEGGNPRHRITGGDSPWQGTVGTFEPYPLIESNLHV